MKLKNTLGVVIGSLVAVSSLNALAQGQGAVEIEGFAKKQYFDSAREFDNDGNLFGGSIGYFLTDDVELRLGYDEVHNARSNDGRNIKGSNTALDALYHFNSPSDSLRPYISAGFSDQSIGQNGRSGRNGSTFANLGGGAKYYFTENFYARAGVEAQYNIDQGDTEWAPSIGIGLNFGGGSAPAPAPVAEPAPYVEEAPATPEAAETVRVELDVKFDFDKSKVKEESYSDIKNLADFMNQYPQTNTTVEGHTDSVGTDAYNQKLSERRANAVRDVLVNEYGVGSERVGSVGYGESRPVADNATEAGRAVNRRVEAEVEAQAK
ncbi:MULTISPECIES: OmpA family protein [Pseudomonas]|jgi:OOP family OmpA-OmpF porin|uniref:OmpA family protein n=1 Tax=Pseudomonas TaxID=286 RepID=UPI001C7ED816|nr:MULTISPECIES: OmpA family protein [Pseudomonas]MDG9930116.1 OmpA family protein [Pseudomonas sp. GD04042]MDH0483482.1 OmpA family protein [Pseudomonas sp. GD04015]MDH0605478.1 OmpA family protein [Pseudomonas sp. GD03869]MDH0894742.1 OmpA family protein [Pseudomonas sp. GD03875]MDH1065189.1 OmpA family protein [Pseudomonas sp. GD03985]